MDASASIVLENNFCVNNKVFPLSRKFTKAFSLFTFTSGILKYNFYRKERVFVCKLKFIVYCSYMFILKLVITSVNTQIWNAFILPAMFTFTHDKLKYNFCRFECLLPVI